MPNHPPPKRVFHITGGWCACMQYLMRGQISKASTAPRRSPPIGKSGLHPMRCVVWWLNIAPSIQLFNVAILIRCVMCTRVTLSLKHIHTRTHNEMFEDTKSSMTPMPTSHVPRMHPPSFPDNRRMAGLTCWNQMSATIDVHVDECVTLWYWTCLYIFLCILSVPHDLSSQDLTRCEWLHKVVFVCFHMMSCIVRRFFSRPNSKRPRPLARQTMLAAGLFHHRVNSIRLCTLLLIVKNLNQKYQNIIISSKACRTSDTS